MGSYNINIDDLVDELERIKIHLYGTIGDVKTNIISVDKATAIINLYNSITKQCEVQLKLLESNEQSIHRSKQ